MSHKPGFSFLGLGLVIIAAAVLAGGCSETTGTSTTYYCPNWMPDGRIIACKEEMTFTKNLWGTGVSGYKYYITTLTIDNSNEVTKEENLFEIDRRVAEVTCSPTGEMIAYITKTPSTRDIVIKDYSGQTLYEPASDAKYLDWSPDAASLVYNANNKLYTINIDGTNNALITSEAYGSVAWRVGDIIVYSGLYSINPDGSGQISIVSGSNPQKTNTNEVVYIGTDGIYRVNINGSSNTRLFSEYSIATLKLSFNGSKIVGGDLSSVTNYQAVQGIWVTNISDGYAKRLR